MIAEPPAIDSTAAVPTPCPVLPFEQTSITEQRLSLHGTLGHPGPGTRKFSTLIITPLTA